MPNLHPTWPSGWGKALASRLLCCVELMGTLMNLYLFNIRSLLRHQMLRWWAATMARLCTKCLCRENFSSCQQIWNSSSSNYVSGVGCRFTARTDKELTVPFGLTQSVEWSWLKQQVAILWSLGLTFDPLWNFTLPHFLSCLPATIHCFSCFLSFPKVGWNRFKIREKHSDVKAKRGITGITYGRVYLHHHVSYIQVVPILFMLYVWNLNDMRDLAKMITVESTCHTEPGAF